ncbi:MAG: molybdopterin molybdotransferase MoeA [Lysobacteraceae bacterium]
MNNVPIRIAHHQAEDLLDELGRALRLTSMTIEPSDALGCVVADDVFASIDLPPFDNSAMDGFAYRHADLGTAGGRLRLIGEQFAGRDLGAALGQGECLRITTGAPLPRGADSVAIKEDCRIVDGEDGQSRVELPAGLKAGAHRRPAGEDAKAGDLVMSAGQVVDASRLGVLAALGLTSVKVAAKPRVAVFSSGDELRPAGEPLAPGEIHDSNGPMLAALLAEEGIAIVSRGSLPDDPGAIRSRLAEAAKDHDLVITCGGVSAGEKDHITATLAEIGEIVLWKVRIKPGMPLLCARLGDCAVLGLPGNPVSVLVTWLVYGRRLLDAMQGRREARPRLRARLGGPLHKRHSRMEFQRGHLSVDAQGTLWIAPDPATPSNRLCAAAAANALLVVGEGEQRLAEGDVVEVIPLRMG